MLRIRGNENEALVWRLGLPKRQAMITEDPKSDSLGIKLDAWCELKRLQINPPKDPAWQNDTYAINRTLPVATEYQG